MRLGTFQIHIDEMCKQREITLKKAAQLVQQIGIENVCVGADWISSPLEEKKRLNDVGFNITDAFGNINFITGTNVKEDIERLIERAKILDVERLQVTTEAFRNPVDTKLCAEDIEKVIQGLDFCGKISNSYGITTVIEDYDVNNGPLTYGAQMKKILENTTYVKFAFDSGNFVHANEDEIKNLKNMLPWLAQVHFKDRSIQKYREAETITNHYTTLNGTEYYPCPVGSGIIHFPEIMNIFHEVGYDGMILIEHFNSPDQFAYLKKSVKYLKKLEDKR